MQHWNVKADSLEIQEMPFYWRLSGSSQPHKSIPPTLGIRVTPDLEHDYLRYNPTAAQWAGIDEAYRQDANIGFLKPDSGHLNTYGSAVNQFFGDAVLEFKPKNIFEIGCGAGLSITFLKEKGFTVTGIDPSEYSRKASEALGFKLIPAYFSSLNLSNEADLIYCNDVFEHVRNVDVFAKEVHRALKEGGIFCIATTNSDLSIELGDISMFEHQHVNMFTERSMTSILRAAGFGEVRIHSGGYGKTFHVIARKNHEKKSGDLPAEKCKSYFSKAAEKIQQFGRFYESTRTRCGFYVPLRCLPYLATVGDFGLSPIFDSNLTWRDKFIDGYTKPVKALDDVTEFGLASFFVGSLTFHEQIAQSLVNKGFPQQSIFSVRDLK